MAISPFETNFGALRQAQRWQQDTLDHLSIGFAGGFFSFGVVCVLLRYDPISRDNSWFYLGVSALVGLLGKEHDYYLRSILRFVFRNGKVDDDNEKH